MIREFTKCDEMILISDGANLNCTKNSLLVILLEIKTYLNGLAIAKIVSLRDVVKWYWTKWNALIFHIYDWNLTIVNYVNGLYYVDIINLETHKSKFTIDHYAHMTLLNIARSNMEHSIRKEIESRGTIQLVQGHVHWPFSIDFKRCTYGREILNFKTISDDINSGLAIYGTLELIVKGNMTRKPPQCIKFHTLVAISSPVLRAHPTNDISIDLFFRKKIPPLDEILCS